jgi:hypothetical protein
MRLHIDPYYLLRLQEFCLSPQEKILALEENFSSVIITRVNTLSLSAFAVNLYKQLVQHFSISDTVFVILPDIDI